ncbi:DUF4214 domain-containing protein [Verticiella sediminum]|uniref:DUF4214 domain-containing protein n=1 Tax=Verticiella sediminum TaxID=1247510 RepID=A0A556AFE5_9BURK|nr:DUF4214 domain-containing protein [Verticiella sediminum]TSH91608.1 DUF4214 domain-containing protein [Verticiella sediminum]
MAISIPEAREAVAGLFISYLGRAPEYAAMSYYVGRLQAILGGQEEEDTESAVKALSAEIYQTAGRVGEIPSGANVTHGELVDWVYQNILGRAADAEGRGYWISQLESGNFGPQDLVATVIAAVQGQGEGRDFDYFSNRVEVALEFAKFGNSNPNVLAKLPFDAAQVLAGVNEDSATVDAAFDKLYAARHGGETVYLTPGVDTLEGTSGDDTFVSLPVNPATGQETSTLTAFDSIDGGAGKDTLQIHFVQGTNDTLPANLAVRNVEVIRLVSEDGSGFGESIDAARFAGAQEIWQVGSEATIYNVGAGMTAGFAGFSDENIDVFLADGVGTANIRLEGIGPDDAFDPEIDIDVEGKALGTVNLSGTVVGDDTYVHLDAYVGTKVQTFTLNTEIATLLHIYGYGDTDAAVKTVDASASSGAILYEVDESVSSVKTGSGDDLVVFDSGRGIRAGDTVDAGEGENAVAFLQSTFQTENYDAINSGLANVQTLIFAGEDVAFDASKVANYKTLVVADAEGDGSQATVSNLAADQTLVLVENDGVVFDLDAVQGVQLLNAAADVNVEVAFSKFSYVYLAFGEDGESLGATGGTLALTGTAWAPEISVFAPGGNLSFSNESGKFSTIDASALEASLYIGGMSSAVAETLILGEGVDAMIHLSVGTAAGENSSSIGALDVIEGYNAETGHLWGVNAVDTLVLDSSVDSLLKAYSAAAVFYNAGEYDAEANQVVLFVYGGDTYLYADTYTPDGAAAGYDAQDFAIKLVGEYSQADFAELG